jgi:OPT oligopeptide transporter protein
MPKCTFFDCPFHAFLLLQQPGYDIIAQFMIGYVLPGKPIANLLFKIYGRISTIHALSFLADLKLGHYMKIPPRCMYIAQVMNISFSLHVLFFLGRLNNFMYDG